jgi:hypothetical protein
MFRWCVRKSRAREKLDSFPDFLVISRRAIDAIAADPLQNVPFRRGGESLSFKSGLVMHGGSMLRQGCIHVRSRP